MEPIEIKLRRKYTDVSRYKTRNKSGSSNSGKSDNTKGRRREKRDHSGDRKVRLVIDGASGRRRFETI